MGKSVLIRSLLLFVLISSLTGACTNEKGIDSQHEGDRVKARDSKIELRIISSWGGVDSKAETLKRILDIFEKKNEDITVINESLFGEDFLPKIKTDFASGNDPDVFGLWPGSDINMLVKAGKVADLTGLLNDDPGWKDSFSPDMWGYTTYNERIYGLPVEVIFECMFINKDLFAKYGVHIPNHYDDLKYAITVFRENNIVPIAFNTYAEGTFLYQNMAASIGGKSDIESPFSEGRIKPSHITTMKYIKELYDMKAFPDNCFTMTNKERNALFKEKKAAMIVQGSWFIGEFGADDQTVDIIHIPYIKGYASKKDTVVYGLGGGTFHMSSAATENEAKYEASVKLLKALTSPGTAAVFAAETGMISNVDISGYNIVYGNMALKGRKMLEQSGKLVGPLDSFVDRAAWEEYIAKRFPYFLSGETTADEMWENAIVNGIIPD